LSNIRATCRHCKEQLETERSVKITLRVVENPWTLITIRTRQGRPSIALDQSNPELSTTTGDH
jgi:hypothetical protein